MSAQEHSNDGFDFLKYANDQTTLIICILSKTFSEIGICHELLSFTGHHEITELWTLMHSKLDVFNFMMKQGYTTYAISSFERKYGIELSADLRYSMLLCKPISFPLIFVNQSVKDYMFSLNPYTTDELVDVNNPISKYYPSLHDVCYSVLCLNQLHAPLADYFLSPEFLISPLSEWSFLTKRQINDILLFNDSANYCSEENKITDILSEYLHYDIDGLLQYFRFAAKFKAIAKRDDLEKRFILIGTNRFQDHNFHELYRSYLVYDIYSGAVLTSYAQPYEILDGSQAFEMLGYTYTHYASFAQYMKTFLYFDLTYFENITSKCCKHLLAPELIPTMRKQLIHYIRDYITPSKKYCIRLVDEAFQMRMDDEKNSNNNARRVWHVWDESPDRMDFIINEQFALHTLKKYFRKDIRKSIFYKFWNVLKQKMQFKLNKKPSEVWKQMTVDDLVKMITNWIKKNPDFSKRMAKNKLIYKFNISKQEVRTDHRFVQAIDIIKRGNDV